MDGDANSAGPGGASNCAVTLKFASNAMTCVSVFSSPADPKNANDTPAGNPAGEQSRLPGRPDTLWTTPAESRNAPTGGAEIPGCAIAAAHEKTKPKSAFITDAPP